MSEIHASKSLMFKVITLLASLMLTLIGIIYGITGSNIKANAENISECKEKTNKLEVLIYQELARINERLGKIEGVLTIQ